MAQTNHERVGKALMEVRDTVRPPLVRIWRARYGPKWLQSVNQRLYHPDRHANPDDLAFLLKAMDATWNEFFRDLLSRSTRSYLHLLRDARNDWAHNKRFSSEETLRVLDHSEMVLEAFRAEEAAKRVKKLKQGLQRQVYNEERRQAGRAATTKGEPAAGLKPWREVVTPHRDVREGRFAQAEFAADLRQVVRGEAADEYGDPVSFYERTFITDGLRDLIRTAARRLSGEGGDPVVELQTGFGGGKTHSLIALYHLASGTSRLRGVGDALVEDRLEVPDDIRRAVFTGQWAEPASIQQKPGGVEIHTMWGDIAYQLGGVEGYRMVEDADRNAANPGESLVDLFKRFGPVMILIDEWVAYARGLPMNPEEGRRPAGDFDTQFTFAQALTEAASAVENALLVVSVPESSDPNYDSMEVGGDKGRKALERLRHVLGRKAAQWRPASSEESFEIVRRRLFEPIDPSMTRYQDAVVKAYHDLYRENAGDFPSETREGDYARRIEAAYPIHPELFDRLYQDWSTLERFQRTRGVLRLMAAVISELWDQDDRSLMIMPGVVPMESAKVVPELTRYLTDNWKPIIDADVDGSGSLPLRLDRDRKNLGRYSACRRVARSTYLGSAPLQADRRGIDRTRIVLGCVQPGENAGVFVDGLRYLADDATYLYNRQNRYWYDTKVSLTRLAADRALTNFDDADADEHLRGRIQSRAVKPLGGVHVFPDGPGDVPDEDDAVRLVIIHPEHPYARGGDSPAEEMAEAILEERLGGRRINRNMVVFLAADEARVPELRQTVRNRLAWHSIFEDRGEHDLNLTPADASQAKTRQEEADRTIDLQIAETFSRVLYPVQEHGQSEIRWTPVRVSGGAGLIERVVTKLESSEHLITKYSGTRVRLDLDRKEAPLWEGKDHIGVRDLWSYYCRYLYMPRLAGFGVLAAAISQGVAELAWQHDTFAYADGFDPEKNRYLGLKAAAQVEVTPSALLVRSEPAQTQFDVQSIPTPKEPPEGVEEGWVTTRTCEGMVPPKSTAEAPKPTRFYGRIALDPIRGVRDLSDIINEVADHLRSAGDITLTLEIEARSDGYDTRTQRIVSENAKQLGFENHEFEA